MSDIKMKSLDEFLQDTFTEEFLKEAAVEYTLAQIAGRAHKAKEDSELSSREIAARMGLKSQAVVQRIVTEARPHNITLSTLVRFSHACGYELNVEFKQPIVMESWLKYWEGIRDDNIALKAKIKLLEAQLAKTSDCGLAISHSMWCPAWEKE